MLTGHYNYKISVIIPTYKPQSYLWECLESLAKQTFPKQHFEIILVLNGCTEPWKSQIEEFISKKMVGMNVIFIHTEQSGVSNARNIALDIVSGEYVTFIDDDDFVSENYLEALYKKAYIDTISLCYPYAFNDGKPDKQLPYSITSAYDKWADKMPVRLSSTVRKYFSGPCMKLIPMCFIHGRRFNPAFSNGEDSLFMFLISDCFDRFAFTDKTAVYYRRYRTGSAVTSYRSKGMIIRNSFSMICEYTKIFFRGIPHYNFGFYITRIFASIRSVFK